MMQAILLALAILPVYDAQGVQVLHARGDVHQAQQDCPLQLHKLLTPGFWAQASLLSPHVLVGLTKQFTGDALASSREALHRACTGFAKCPLLN